LGLDDLNFKSVSELSRMLRSRKVSSVELTKHFLERLQQFGPGYNAVAELTSHLAMTEARLADKRLRKSTHIESPLLGVPYGVKDIFATKNIPTRWGAPPFRHQVFSYDATVIQSMQHAGSVLIGKLAMIELAGAGGYAKTNASLHGPGLNPWNTQYWSGGSSSGSGSAVAAGLLPFALGTETWGSIICPSAFCGITGLRPTFGRVSRFGVMELAWNIDKVGPMARSAEDCGLILQAIAGEDLQDQSTIGYPIFKFRPRISPKRFHLGILSRDFSHEPGIERIFKNALRVLREAGTKFSFVKLPDYLVFSELATTIMGGEIAAAHAEFIKSKQLNQLVDSSQKQDLKNFLHITATDYLRAVRKRDLLAKQVFETLNKFDAFVSPSVTEAVKINTNLLKIPSHKRDHYSVLGTLFGLPALTIPMGFGKNNLPLGMSITGKLFDENTLLQIGMLFQQETNWHRMSPSI